MNATLNPAPRANSFASWASNQNLTDWRNQLGAAYDNISQVAADAGIDWARLQQALPTPGTLLKGSALPSLSERDRGRNAFVWYLNSDRHGCQWPCLLFMSFRHGGVHQIMHLRRWAWDRFNRSRGLPLPVSLQPPPQIGSAPGYRDIEAEALRARRFALARQRWQQASALTPDEPLLQQRLCGDAPASLLKRMDLRCNRDRLGVHLMFRLQHHQHGHTGFQYLYAQPLDGVGRTQHLIIRQAGLKKGSFGCIRATPGHEHWPVAICEGLFTALSVALGWPGPLAVALDAGNLRHVRAAIGRSCVFFADDDRAGNRHTGWHQARAAQQPGDRIILPDFGPGEHADALSDFNDLHRASGLAEVQRQIRQAWPQPEIT